MDERELKVMQDVEKHGWHVIKVLGDESGPAFAYSIGLFKSFQHPEVMIVGLASDTMHKIINNIGLDVKQGKTFQNGLLSDDILDGYTCALREVSLKHYKKLVGWAIWFYDGTNFPLVQCVWPDRHRHFPWERGCAQDIRDLQPTYFDAD